jgi:hypothetical protein
MVPNGLIRERTIQNPMRTSGSTFQISGIQIEHAVRLKCSA